MWSFEMRRAVAWGSAMALMPTLLAGAGPVLRIMPLGDSITDGFPIPAGYRASLYQQLTNAGYNVDLVGTMTDNGAAWLPDSDHEGHPGWRIDQITSGFAGWVAAVKDPDVILLLIGTNDYGLNYDPANAISRLDVLLSRIAALRPKARVVVANLLKRTDNAAVDSAIETSFNPHVAGIVAKHAALGQWVHFLDLRSALGTADLADGLHPNQVGYNKMATNWVRVVSQLIGPNLGNGQLVNFDGACLDGALNLTAIPGIYQPVPGVTIGYTNVGVFNAGPDHTSGILGGSHYSTYNLSGAGPQVFTFSTRVAIPSVWLSTYDGGTSGASLSVSVRAYADAAGTVLLTNATVATAAHPNGSAYIWTPFAGLATVGTNIMRVEFAAEGVAQVDDLVLNVSTNLGSLQGIQLRLPSMSLYTNLPQQANLTAQYQSGGNVDVTTGAGAVYVSSNPDVVTVSASGLVRAVGVGTAMLSTRLETFSNSVAVTVLPGMLVDFNTGLGNIGNFVTIPSTYQPVPGLTIGYSGVGMFNGGPDHTAGIVGDHYYNTYQYGSPPQIYTFSRAVSLPSVWLASFNGSGSSMTIQAYSDTAGADLLGTVYFVTPIHASGGGYVWGQCTNLDRAAFNGRIRRVQFSAADNAQVDDITLIVNPNAGILQNLTLTLPATNLFRGMSRQAVVSANYQFASNVDVTTEAGVVYSSSDTNVVCLTSHALVQAVGAGTATVTAMLQSLSCSVGVTVSAAAGTLVDFNNGLADTANRTVLTASYQPVPGVTIGYSNVGLFSQGPDNTTGISGGNHYNTFQYANNSPQVFTFSRPVSLPSVWLACFEGGGNPVTIKAYGDTAGTNLLGTVSFVTPTHPYGSGYLWGQCTNLGNVAYDGRIRRLEVSGVNCNAQVDDMAVVPTTIARGSLSTAVSGGKRAISWPTSSGGGTLMSSPVLGPGAVWNPVAGTPSTVGSNYQVVVPLSGGSQFFRLQY